MAHFTVIFKSLAPHVVAGFGNRPEAELAAWAASQRRFPERDLTQFTPQRQLEHWCVDQCLEAMEQSALCLVHDPNGKPMAMDTPDLHVGIAHHSGAEGCWASVALADAPIGVDIESEREQLRRIAGRFLHPDEQRAIGDDVASLAIAWAVKESMFKAHGPALDFRQDLRIQWPGHTNARTSGVEGTVHGAAGQYRVWRLEHPAGEGPVWLASGPAR